MQAKVALLLVGLVGLCVADEPVQAATPLRYTPQEKYLAHSAVGNFACKVNAVEVTLDVPGDEDKMVVSAADLEAYLSQTATLEWTHVNQFSFASLDGRNDEKIMGTAGGDMGEFIQALQAYTKITGVVLTPSEVESLFARLLKTMSREKFSFSTDEKAYRKLAIATGCQNLKIADIGEKRKKDLILSKFESEDLPEFLGDPFLKFLSQNLEATGVRREYIVSAIQAFHLSLWRHNAESDALCYLEFKGRVDPKALIRVKTPGYCVDQGLTPLISPQVCAGQTFIVHTDAVKLFRRELVNLIAKPGDNLQDILAEFNTLAQTNLEKFWDTFSGLPSFTVTFKNTTPLLE